MTAGVSYESISSRASFSVYSGAADANYPVSNLADLCRPSKPARISGSSPVILRFTLPSLTSVQCIALVAHNIAAGASYALHCYSDSFTTMVVNLAGTVPTPVAGYTQVFPIILSSAANILTGDLYIYQASVEIGAIEIAKWWSWPLSPGKAFGFAPAPVQHEMIGGFVDVEDRWAPRVMNGQIDYLALATAATTGLDFQRVMRKSKPFVFAQEASDPTTFPRTAMLAVNNELPASVGALYRHDAFQFRLLEYWR